MTCDLKAGTVTSKVSPTFSPPSKSSRRLNVNQALRRSISENSGEPALKFSPSEATRVVTWAAIGAWTVNSPTSTSRWFSAASACLTGAGGGQLQRRLSRLAFASSQFQIAGGFIDNGLGRIPGAGKLSLPVKGFLVKNHISFRSREFGLAGSDRLR